MPTSSTGSPTSTCREFFLSASAKAAGDEPFYQLYSPLPVEGQLAGQLALFTPGSSNAVAGLMGRTGVRDEDAFLAVVQDSAGQIWVRQRSASGGDVSVQRSAVSGSWLKLIHSTSSLEAYASPDRVNWTLLGTLPLATNASVLAGPVVGPGDPSVFSTAGFAEVQCISLQLLQPLADQTFTSPGTIPVEVSTISSNDQPASVSVSAGDVSLGQLSSPPYRWAWKDPVAGSYLLRATATDKNGVAFISDPVPVTVTLAPAAARFDRVDSATQGNWKAAYGSDGSALPGLPAVLPASVELDVSAQTVTPTNATTDPRALLLPDASGRIASIWTSPGVLSVALQLNDARLHEVALYFADPSATDTQDEQVQVLDADSGQVLNTQTVTNASAGEYLVWSLRGNVRINITGLGTANAVLSGVFLEPSINPLPAVSLSALPSKVSLPLVLQADASAAQGSVSRVEFYDTATLLGIAQEFPYVLFWTNATVGVHQLTTRAVDDLGNYNDSPPVEVNVQPPTAAAVFLGVDAVTAGDWKPRYLSYIMPGIATNSPGSIEVSFSDGEAFVWGQDVDSPAALENPAGDWRTAAALYGDQLSIVINCLDQLSHPVALYFLDWDSGGRVQNVSFTATADGSALDSRLVSAFSSGVYYVWNIRGRVELDIQPQLMNGVLSGLFFDQNPQQPLVIDWLPFGTMLRGPPGRQVLLNYSNDLSSWTPFSTNSIPQSGILVLRGLTRAEISAGFYQAKLLTPP